MFAHRPIYPTWKGQVGDEAYFRVPEYKTPKPVKFHEMGLIRASSNSNARLLFFHFQPNSFWGTLQGDSINVTNKRQWHQHHVGFSLSLSLSLSHTHTHRQSTATNFLVYLESTFIFTNIIRNFIVYFEGTLYSWISLLRKKEDKVVALLLKSVRDLTLYLVGVSLNSLKE
jgi:hypothetical protein